MPMASEVFHPLQGYESSPSDKGKPPTPGPLSPSSPGCRTEQGCEQRSWPSLVTGGPSVRSLPEHPLEFVLKDSHTLTQPLVYEGRLRFCRFCGVNSHLPDKCLKRESPSQGTYLHEKAKGKDPTKASSSSKAPNLKEQKGGVTHSRGKGSRLSGHNKFAQDTPNHSFADPEPTGPARKRNRMSHCRVEAPSMKVIISARVSWTFLKNALIDLGFSTPWIGRVMTCVSYDSFVVLVDGVLGDFHPMHRGLRQGDPMSSYLLLVVMKDLSRNLKYRRWNGSMSPPYIPRIGACPTLLTFADDLIIFSRGDHRCYSEVMHAFEALKFSSRLCVNPQKSHAISFENKVLLPPSSATQIGYKALCLFLIWMFYSLLVVKGVDMASKKKPDKSNDTRRWAKRPKGPGWDRRDRRTKGGQVARRKGKLAGRKQLSLPTLKAINKLLLHSIPKGRRRRRQRNLKPQVFHGQASSLTSKASFREQYHNRIRVNEGKVTHGRINRKTRDELKNPKDEPSSHNLLARSATEQEKVVSILNGGESL
ncbi:hypothetical protein EJ110_NYTH47053 [Nymphaea thermarum]|nr:hypothetical protein EJ110_NYTH47053 [Nymphaea thermarum]